MISPTESGAPARRLMTMRRTLLFLVVLAAPGAAVADKGDPDVTGTFEVKYEEVANNCTAANTGVSLLRGSLEIARKGKLVSVDIERFPEMLGSQAKAGKLRAASKIGPSPIQGASVKVSTAGRVDDGLISLVFVAEYYVGKKPLCTQSWNVSGVRRDALGKAADIAAPEPTTAPTLNPPAMRLSPYRF